MDLTTRYLGFELPHPLIPGCSPLGGDLDSVRRLEDAGAPMIHLPSLFEEEIKQESLATAAALDGPKNQFAEAASYLPEPESFTVGPEEYLHRVERTKAAVSIPVVASLNGATPGGWMRFAEMMQDAGADAIELNLYRVSSEFDLSSDDLESEDISIVSEVAKAVRVPLAVKISPFYTSMPHVASSIAEAGAQAIVLFNRFYQPDIDVENLEPLRMLELSTSAELRPRLRWLALLSSRINTQLAVTGGVHTAIDAIKAVMCGAHAVQVVSCLLRFGPDYLTKLRDELTNWLEEHEYDSLDQARGSMSQQRSPDPHVYERANYIHLLRSWTAER